MDYNEMAEQLMSFLGAAVLVRVAAIRSEGADTTIGKPVASMRGVVQRAREIPAGGLLVELDLCEFHLDEGAFVDAYWLDGEGVPQFRVITDVSVVDIVRLDSPPTAK